MEVRVGQIWKYVRYKCCDNSVVIKEINEDKAFYISNKLGCCFTMGHQFGDFLKNFQNDIIWQPVCYAKQVKNV